jgi:hypothetical protein
MKLKFLTTAIYAFYAGAILCSLLQGLWRHPAPLPFFLTVLLISAAVVSIIIDARLLCGPELGTRARVLALLVNSGAAVLPVICLRFAASVPLEYDIPSPFTYSSLVPVAVCIAIVPILMFPKNTLLRAMATAIGLIAWPYFISFAVIPIPLFWGMTTAAYSWRAFAFFASVFVFVFAAAAVSYFARLAYILGLVAGLISAAWLIATEFVWFQMMNSWIALNVNGGDPYGRAVRSVAVMRIVAVCLIVVAIVLSLFRLLPFRWTLRKRPVCERTWPAFAVSAITLAVWYGCAVSPYRLPGIVDGGPGPDLRVLHVVKRGLQFHETEISTFRSEFYISRNDRRLFQYAIEDRTSRGVLPATTLQKVSSLRQLPQLKALHPQPAKALRAWNAEGWYYLDEGMGGIGLRSFTSEYGTTPPKEIVDAFREIEGIHPTEDWGRSSINDVCLGFCYDPLAALGFVFANNRCFTFPDGKTRCQ